MDRFIRSVSILLLPLALSACGSSEGEYKNVKALAAAYEQTSAAAEDAYACKLPDRSKRKGTTESWGYEASECLAADHVAESGDHVGLIVAVNSSGEEWMSQYPLTNAMPAERSVLKDPNLNWQITGPTEHLSKVQKELGGELTVGSRTD